LTNITINEDPECAAPLEDDSVEGSVSGEIEPQQTEVTKPEFIFPSEQQKHVWRPTPSQIEETQLGLTLGKEEARFVGEVAVNLTEGGVFGTIE
jgi:hypothetical protein